MKTIKLPEKKLETRYRFVKPGFFGGETTTSNTNTTSTDPTSTTTLSTTHLMRK
jgi:hypothetical protein